MEISLKMLQKIGLPFKDWRPVKELGVGTYGSVFRIESKYGDVCALKVIPIPTSDADLYDALNGCGNDPVKARASFDYQLNMVRDREIAEAKQCGDCPNIYKIYEDAVVEDPANAAQRYIMVRMELLNDLKTYLSRPGTSQKEVMKMMRDIASALVYMERKRILHRDIKTANIMVDGRGVYKLTDFGEARTMQMNGSHTSFRGTPYYMAPEVQRGKYDNRADIYSLGIVTYYFLNGRKYPFVGGSIRANDGYEMRMKGQRCPAIPGVDREVNRIVLRCVAYDMNERYSTAAELLSDINNVLKHMKGGEPVRRDEHPSNDPTPSPTPTPRTSGGGLSPAAIVSIVLGSVALLTLIIVLIIVSSSSGSDIPDRPDIDWRNIINWQNR